MEAIHWHSFFFLLFALIAAVFAVAVVVSNNIVRMACYLVVSLGAVAGLFFLAGADFLGAVQLLVYVGGTMVLLVFGVMLTARGPFVSMKTGGGQWIIAAIVSMVLLAIMLQVSWSIPEWAGPKETLAERQPGQIELQPTSTPTETQAKKKPGQLDIQPTSTQIGWGLLGVRTDQLEQRDPLARQGMSGYLLVFEILSIHLLVVLVGAAFLARAKRRVERGSNE
jgi:NADH-quinone oxidoreductase subunit J